TVLLGEEAAAARPVRGAGPAGRGGAGAHWNRAGPSHRAPLEGWHLRRARRRAFLGGVLPPRGHDLRVLLALHGAGGVARGGPRRNQRASRSEGEPSG